MSTHPSNQSVEQISVEELNSRMQGDRTTLQLVDVREPEELAIAQVDGFTSLPLSQFAEWSETIKMTLDPDAETIVMCHHGVRSAQMCQWLISQGFTNVKNLAGGIDAYSAVVDPTVPQY